MTINDEKVDNERDEYEKLPNQQELEKELSDYLSKKYGNRIKILSPVMLPKGDVDEIDDGGEYENKKSPPTFDMLPEELEAHLDTFVVKQDEAKAVLSTKICTHFNRVNFLNKIAGKKKTTGVGMIKNNVLMIGPTGVGKTYMIKLVAQKLGVPLVKGDATKFSETGYVGGDVEDLVRDLVYEADEDIELAENGIIYIDEIDKIASSNNLIGHDVSRTGVQRALLEPMEETEVDLKVAHDPVSQIQAIEHFRRTGKKEKRVVNTKNILFIMSGAFGALTDIIKKRLQKQGIGFEADVTPTEIPWEIMKEVTAQDLVEFGFESEFIGRLPVIVVFDELTKDDLAEILKNPNNPVIVSKRQDFRAYGIDIKFEDEALDKMADMAAKMKTGARGLVSAVEKILIPFEKHLPSTEIKELLVTPELVENPKEELEHLIEDYNKPERLERFEKMKKKELENIAGFISQREKDFKHLAGLELNQDRRKLIGEIYLNATTDINTAFEDFKGMYKQIRDEEIVLAEKLDISMSFDEEAVDELIRQSIESNREPGPLAFYIAKKLEYGLKLVKDRSGIEHFIISRDAIVDMEKYVNNLLKKYYKHHFDENDNLITESLDKE
ncbi:MAG: AAA family ATPase [Desulfobacteraceae bacterium]|jgi:endopeptidase Clp ATP-binding regulatory subunit ClpX